MKNCFAAFVCVSLSIFKITKFIHQSSIFHSIIQSGNLLILEYLSGIEQSRISHFQALNTLGKLKLQDLCPQTMQGVSQQIMDPSSVENMFHRLAMCKYTYIFPNSIKKSASQIFWATSCSPFPNQLISKTLYTKF